MNQPKVLVYTSANCPYCAWSKKLLDKKQANYEEIRVDQDDAARIRLQKLTKRTSVPQIFIDDTHIGGYQDMVELDQDGELDKLLCGGRES
ncbi:MAG: glutaredoxin 3 [Chromatiales bacterium]|nr:glutaredoxin 3 [Chromatiales bacterium]